MTIKKSNKLTIPKKIPENLINSIKACLSHAEDLIRAAKRLLADENLPNISYHLAALALEEIGKSTLLGMDYFAKQSGDTIFSASKFYDDHVKKLFWATWGQYIGHEKITRKQIESLQGLSQRIHENRLQGLYVDFNESGPIVPGDAISKPEAQNLISFAAARLKLAKLKKWDELEDERRQVIAWFITASSDKEKRGLIFGSKSMEKLVELGTNKWARWLKQEFDKADEEAKKAARLELQRKPPTDLERLKDKWKVKIRIFSNSHSIRPQPLNEWNKLDSWIKLYPVSGKKDQLIAEFTLPKIISVHNLWWASWGTARKFVLSLNIATFGCFWWYVPEQISRFYEKISDLENSGMEVKVERNPKLELDWGHNALSVTNLHHTALCFSELPGSEENESELGQSMGAYLTALAFLNKSDIHLQFEANSYEFFYTSLKFGMKHFKEWDGNKFFPDVLEEKLQSDQLPQNDIDKLKNISQQFESERPSFKNTKLTLSEVGLFKTICDAYFLVKFDEANKARKAKKNA